MGRRFAVNRSCGSGGIIAFAKRREKIKPRSPKSVASSLKTRFPGLTILALLANKPNGKVVFDIELNIRTQIRDGYSERRHHSGGRKEIPAKIGRSASIDSRVEIPNGKIKEVLEVNKVTEGKRFRITLK